MKRFKVIKNYKNHVLKIIKTENLILKQKAENFIDPNHHTVAIPCLNSKKENVLLRVLITSDKKKNQSFIKEILLNKFLKKYDHNFNKLPILLKGSISSKTKWMIRRYYIGKQTGDFWSLNKKFFNQTNSDLLIDYILKLQNKSPEIINHFSKLKNKGNLTKRTAKWFINDWKKDLDYNPDFIYNNFIKKYFNNHEIKKINTIINNNKILLNKYCSFFTHGDLMPQNILIDNKDKIFFIDWEEAHINNPLFDISYIYVNTWNNKKWQKQFLNQFIKLHPIENKEDLKTLANINILIISLRMAEYAYLNLVHNNTIINQAFKNHLKTIKFLLDL